MEYRINHVHIRAADPHATAAWYEKHFNAPHRFGAGGDAAHHHHRHGDGRGSAGSTCRPSLPDRPMSAPWPN